MTPRLDLTPATIQPPRVQRRPGVPVIEGFDVAAEPSGRATMIYRSDFGVWLTREALLEAVPRVLASKVREDRLAAQAWIVRDTADQADTIRRMLRERRGGAQ